MKDAAKGLALAVGLVLAAMGLRQALAAPTPPASPLAPRDDDRADLNPRTPFAPAYGPYLRRSAPELQPRYGPRAY